ncbi:PQQ-binding-like beta-propeller repeat protein [Nocardiopsis sp. HNM0947]|uniref:PQQ-binding-like beta-propeller repeat protein n=1 Tax=Nocardiopsis coralli TaxID=2772213 RepID=A0ABR9P9B0_9ACTN|nr:PQQ-binding-like beta-propeller repeat protein [Nocardiopsis coralli]MBE3000426.1 PQQ-binding-like beta-propeller repeat protein [Nocardiopsis coralli]
MPRGTSPAAVACALTLLVSSCSLLEDEPEGPEYAPTAISPDELVHCEDEGDCGEAGAVRWSVPLEDDYHVHLPHHQDPAVLTPVQDAVVTSFARPRAVVHEGTVHLHERDRFSAFDAGTGEVLRSGEQADPGQNKSVDELFLEGDRLVLHAIEPRDWNGLFYTAEATPEGALEWQAIEPPEGEFDAASAHTYGEGLLVLQGDQPPGEHGAPHPYHLVDASTGEAEWSADLPGRTVDRGVVGDTLYVSASGDAEEDDPDLLFEVDLADGDVGDPVELAEHQRGGRLVATSEDRVVLQPNCDPKDDEDPCTRPVTGMDTGDGDVVWEHPEPSTVREVVEEDEGVLLLVEDADGYWWVDPEGGEVVRAAGGGEARLAALAATVSMPWHEEGATGEENDDPFTAAAEINVPGHEPITVDHASGIAHVTDYATDDGAAVSLFTGCAPDGLEPEEAAAPADGNPCSSPRLFAVDLGI